MGDSYNSGLTTAAITGTITATNLPAELPPGAVKVAAADQQSGAGTKDIYTVTAGKTLYITNAWVGIACGTGAGTGKVQVDLNGDGAYKVIVACGAYGSASVYASGNNAISPTPPIQVPAGKKVQIVSSAGYINCDGGFVGYEV